MATDTLDKKHTDHDSTANASWDGAEYPFKVGYGKLMIWYFLLSDAFTFAGFLIAYGTLRFSMPSWPVPDYVFSTFPFLEGHHPLLFVTLMTFVLLFSSFTMIRAVQEGHRENRRGVAIWMGLTIIGGLGFLGCQAWEWTTLIGKEHMSVTTNPFGTHTESGIYLDAEGKESSEVFAAGTTYLLHKATFGGEHAAAADHTEETAAHGEEAAHADAAGHGGHAYKHPVTILMQSSMKEDISIGSILYRMENMQAVLNQNHLVRKLLVRFSFLSQASTVFTFFQESYSC